MPIFLDCINEKSGRLCLQNSVPIYESLRYTTSKKLVAEIELKKHLHVLGGINMLQKMASYQMDFSTSTFD